MLTIASTNQKIESLVKKLKSNNRLSCCQIFEAQIVENFRKFKRIREKLLLKMLLI